MNDKADSSITGAILMVAITVILAMIIGALVFGMAGSRDLRKEAIEYQDIRVDTNCTCIQENLSFCIVRTMYSTNAYRCLQIVCPECIGEVK